MESLIVALIPYLDMGASIAVILMLRVAWGIYQKIVLIEKELVAFKATVTTQIDNMERRIDIVEKEKKYA